MIDRVRTSLIGLRMPRALEVPDDTMQCHQPGEVNALEVIDIPLSREYAIRKAAVSAPRLVAASPDFSWLP